MSLLAASSDPVSISRGRPLALPANLNALQHDFHRATEMAALSAVPWFGRGDKNSADAAAVDAIRAVFAAMDMRGEIVIGEGMKDEAPGLFQGERVGSWNADSPRVDIAVDPLDGTTNVSKGLPNAISCIAAALRRDESVPALQFVPAFYMRKLACSRSLCEACRHDRSITSHFDGPLRELIELTASTLSKNVQDVVVMCLDRPRNQRIIDEVREIGASLRLIVDGDILAALSPAISSSDVDLYIGIGGGPEAILAAVGLRCLGGELLGQMWPRDDVELSSLRAEGWSDQIQKIYNSRELAGGDDLLLIATGVSDSCLLRGVRVDGTTATTDSLLIRSQSMAVRRIQTEHHGALRPLQFSTPSAKQYRVDAPTITPARVSNQRSAKDLKRADHDITGILLIGAPGSGKGTIGKTLNRIDGIMHIATGDLIRKAMAEKSLHSRCQVALAQGGLISDASLWELFDSHLDALVRSEPTFSSPRLLVLDGVPRTRAQVDELANRVDVRAVLYLECENLDVLYERLLYRSVVEGRVDDGSRQVVQNRLRLFEEETLPILDAYPSSIVHRIDATLRPAHVLAAALVPVNQLAVPTIDQL